jgi:transcriptional regulator with XRE-family HTH domain
MASQTISGNPKLGEAIKNRRNELNLTVEGAAKKAGIGTKTWSRYESGESIRRDKVSGLCRALKWNTLPGMDNVDVFTERDLDEYRNSGVWPPYIEERFGKYAALSFVIGSDILLDETNEAINALSEMPKGSHVGEVSSSPIASIMPEQFLMRYDYDFMWAFRHVLKRIRATAPKANEFVAHSVIEELILYLIVEESRCLMEEMVFDFDTDYAENESEDKDEEADENVGDAEDEGIYRDKYAGWDEWAFDIFDDMDIVTLLYSDIFLLSPSDSYHFDNWFEQQFYVSEEESEEESANTQLNFDQDMGF